MSENNGNLLAVAWWVILNSSDFLYEFLKKQQFAWPLVWGKFQFYTYHFVLDENHYG